MINQVTKLWGSEEWLVNNDKYCAKYLNLKKGMMCSLHYHIKKDETFYILEGKVFLELSHPTSPNGCTAILTEGMQWRLVPGQMHRFSSMTETAKILEVSTTHSDEDTVRIEPARPVDS